MSPSLVLASLTLAIWLYLVIAHGGFWKAREREAAPADPAPAEAWPAEAWPAVVAIIPARNEADVLPASLGSLLAQDYPGLFSIILVDDESDDGTGDTARRLAAKARHPVTVLSAPPRPEGWTGKVWAQHTGVAYADKTAAPGTCYLLTDADIAYEPYSLTSLVRRARTEGTVLTSLMAKLRCDSLAERALVPAFVFFFQMLYPFAHANQPKNSTAAAAGGCMLVDAGALRRAGGMAAIKSALIDDCALAAVLKKQGPIWLGLAESVTSLRPYPHLADIGKMVSRSAYAQLRFSPVLLSGTVLGMVLTFLAAPALMLFGAYPANSLALSTFILMAGAFQPTLGYYGVSRLWGFALPGIAALYLAFTLASAWQHMRGQGGMWKGRAQAIQGNR